MTAVCYVIGGARAFRLQEVCADNPTLRLDRDKRDGRFLDPEVVGFGLGQVGRDGIRPAGQENGLDDPQYSRPVVAFVGTDFDHLQQPIS